LDTETTSLDIMTAKLVWISIYLDDERIYYINRLHNWNKVSFEDLQVFVKQILNSNLLIIWHNLKYDLEILERFKNSTNQNYSNQSKKEIITEKVQTSLF
jgi:DNA polymerase I-like protein with 3'-5' exonuclease and polymerase domains